MSLIKPNVEQVYLKVREFENKALDEHGVLKHVLGLMVFFFGRPLGHFSELQIHKHGRNGLSNGGNQVHVALRVKNGTFIRQTRQEGNIEETSVMVRPNDPRGIQEANNNKKSADQAWNANSE